MEMLAEGRKDGINSSFRYRATREHIEKLEGIIICCKQGLIFIKRINPLFSHRQIIPHPPCPHGISFADNLSPQPDFLILSIPVYAKNQIKNCDGKVIGFTIPAQVNKVSF
jgi:hypothetical protein